MTKRSLCTNKKLLFSLETLLYWVPNTKLSLLTSLSLFFVSQNATKDPHLLTDPKINSRAVCMGLETTGDDSCKTEEEKTPALPGCTVIARVHLIIIPFSFSLREDGGVELAREAALEKPLLLLQDLGCCLRKSNKGNTRWEICEKSPSRRVCQEDIFLLTLYSLANALGKHWATSRFGISKTSN